jgi:hypothetical protein
MRRTYADLPHRATVFLRMICGEMADFRRMLTPYSILYRDTVAGEPADQWAD